MDETKQWQSLKSGDINALEALYNHYSSPLYTYGMQLCHEPDKVKDCIHDLFINVWNSREQLNVPDSTKAYLLVSLRRRLFDKGTKLQSMTDSVEDIRELNILSAGYEDQWIREEEETSNAQKLETAMEQLSDRQKEIIHLKYYHQLEYEEICRIMDLNYQSARNLVNRALSVLRKEMLLIVMLLLISL